MKKLSAVRGEVIALILLIPLALILALALNRWPQNAPAATTGPAPSQAVISPTTAPAALSPAPVAAVTMDIVAPTLKKNITVPLSGVATIADAMQAAAKNNQITLQSKDYGGSLGLFIEAIDGIVNDAGGQRYWQLYVNGQKSALGASSVSVTAQDRILWRFETSPEEQF